MRASYGQRMLECMESLGVDASSIKDVVDLGCATGEIKLSDGVVPYWQSNCF